jgi:hypothetical protein
MNGTGPLPYVRAHRFNRLITAQTSIATLATWRYDFFDFLLALPLMFSVYCGIAFTSLYLFSYLVALVNPW